ncbi:hypothetical protein ABOM_005687 [Aspergillus bombycis]|uniref:Uncharacterized protein n=1 Tax=Aspergillus bombycis TaxID=109264 RepID=A0A1F8A304_9EURO|nr:hypothetical protein ABOM_005687 [Aspergillus bombycis]OGM46100.1 hypothetical protein ABOM_005687 [Aspergillus bombycis]
MSGTPARERIERELAARGTKKYRLFFGPPIYPCKSSDAIFPKWDTVRNRILQVVDVSGFQLLGCYRIGYDFGVENSTLSVLVTIDPKHKRDWRIVEHDIKDIVTSLTFIWSICASSRIVVFSVPVGRRPEDKADRIDQQRNSESFRILEEAQAEGDLHGDLEQKWGALRKRLRVLESHLAELEAYKRANSYEFGEVWVDSGDDTRSTTTIMDWALFR